MSQGNDRGGTLPAGQQSLRSRDSRILRGTRTGERSRGAAGGVLPQTEKSYGAAGRDSVSLG